MELSGRETQLLEALKEFGAFGVCDRALLVFMGGEQNQTLDLDRSRENKRDKNHPSALTFMEVLFAPPSLGWRQEQNLAAPLQN